MLSNVLTGVVSLFDVLHADAELLAAVDAGTAAVSAGEDCELCESLSRG